MREIHVSAACYDILQPSDMAAIMHELETRHELPLRFSYIGEGAQRWDKAVTDLPPKRQKAILPDFTSLTNILRERHNTPISVLDLGPGNGLQARALLAYLLEKKQLHRYACVDISPQMLDIAARNIHDWFHGIIQTTTHVKNFIEDPLDDIFSPNVLGDNPRIILVLGGTLDNDPSPVAALRAISKHMRPDDLLVYDILTPTDTPTSSAAFTLSTRHTYLLDVLGITKDCYESKRTYDAPSHIRLDQIIPVDDLRLSYDSDGIRHEILLQRGKPITIWRYHSTTLSEATENIQQSGLELLTASTSANARQILLLCERTK